MRNCDSVSMFKKNKMLKNFLNVPVYYRYSFVVKKIRCAPNKSKVENKIRNEIQVILTNTRLPKNSKQKICII